MSLLIVKNLQILNFENWMKYSSIIFTLLTFRWLWMETNRFLWIDVLVEPSRHERIV